MTGFTYRRVEGDRRDAHVEVLREVKGPWQLHFHRDPIDLDPPNHFYKPCPHCSTAGTRGGRAWIVNWIAYKDVRIGMFLSDLLGLERRAAYGIWARSDGFWALREGTAEVLHFPFHEMSGHEALAIARDVEEGLGPILPCSQGPSWVRPHG